MIKAFIILIIMALPVMAQTTFTGQSLSGVTVGDDLNGLKAQGLVAAYDASRGIILQGTNVQSWVDQTGNGFTLTQFNAANQPTYVSVYSTNNFPVVYFGGSPRNLTSHSLGQFLNGKDFTVIQLLNAQALALGAYSVSLGYSSATNANFPIWSLIPNNTTSNSRLRIGNDAGANTTSSTPATVTTNTFKYMAGTLTSSSGNYLVSVNNSTTSSTQAGARTLDTFSLGCLTGSNMVQSAFFTGAITSTYVFTNGTTQTGTTLTNLLNSINNMRTVF
jgi:hypothetical protein